MDANGRSFNENQLKRVGMGEAFTPELENKMKQGLPAIQHSFSKQYEGDRVDVVLHLKKSSSSDHYFLNKFDMRLQKENQKEPVGQSFYVNNRKDAPDNKYTMKEAYNLLSGRPVHKQLSNKEGQSYEAWVKLNPGKVLDNGNHELKQYTKNYGFNLKATLAHYPIKEMRNEQYAASLMESLGRGNLQKVNFQGRDGKEEKMYISPNIPMGMLNVYNEKKERVPVEKLAENEYISKALADKITARINGVKQEKKQETLQEQKQDVRQVQKSSSQKERQPVQQKEKPVKKQSARKARIR